MGSVSVSWIEHKFGVSLYQRGISAEEQFLKMERLKALGHIRLKTKNGVWYEVEGKRRLYNPIKDTWRSKSPD
jgi:hypothetical protein